ALLKQAGYGPDHPVKVKVMISTSGSGQMLSLPMNEIIQQQVKPIGFDLDFDVVDWGRLLVVKRTAPTAPAAHGVDALNSSLGFSDPASMSRYFSKTSMSPHGINWGHFSDPRVEELSGSYLDNTARAAGLSLAAFPSGAASICGRC